MHDEGVEDEEVEEAEEEERGDDRRDDDLLPPGQVRWGLALGKIAVRERFVLEGARAFGCSYVYANLLGNEAGRAIYDEVAPMALAYQRRLLEGLSPEERAALDRLLTRMEELELATRPG